VCFVNREQREFQVRFNFRESPRRSAMERLVKNLEHTVSVIENKKGVEDTYDGGGSKHL
jgi:hypothetical protein